MDTTTQELLVKKLEELMIKALINFQEIEVDVKEENIIRFNVKSEEPGMLIGKHGETLFALQQVFRVLASKTVEFAGTVVLDVDDYRLNQETSAQAMAADIARKVRSSGAAIELVPMPSYKRRAVHVMFMTDTYKDLEVHSVGEGETRRIRVAKKAE